MLGPIHRRSGKRFVSGAKESGLICKEFKCVGLGDFGTAKTDSQNMRPLQVIHWGRGLESDRGRNSKSMLPECGGSQSENYD